MENEEPNSVHPTIVSCAPRSGPLLSGNVTWRSVGPRRGRLLVEVGDITRFPNKAHFGSCSGTAPIVASSGEQVRHRLSRAGNRQINRVLHTMPRVQLRNPTPGRSQGRARGFVVLSSADPYAAEEREPGRRGSATQSFDAAVAELCWKAVDS